MRRLDGFSRASRWLFTLLLGSWLGASRAAALDGEGQPITSSDYAIDLSQGPVLSTSRVTGLGGAASALAEGVEGGLSNPAAVAARSAGSVDFWDYWVAFGVTYPFQNGDFYNSGDYLSAKSGDTQGQGNENFLFLNTGGYLQLYDAGVGLNLEILQLSIKDTSSGVPDSSLRVRMATSHVQAGYLFWDGQLALAVGMQVLREQVHARAPEMGRRRLQVGTGFGSEAGLLVRPNNKQWRLGAGVYSAVKASFDEATSSGGQAQFVRPMYAVRPWRGNVGFTYQFGKRPLNPRFSYIEEHASAPLHELDERVRQASLAYQRELNELRKDGGPESHARQQLAKRAHTDQLRLLEAERAAVRKRAWRELRAGMRKLWSRRYLLVAAEVSFAGRVNNGVGLESFLVQTVQRSGENVSVTPRVGVESEVWPTHVKVRGGGYVEASRFTETTARPHATMGVDVRLFNWDVFRIWPEDYLWQLSAALDISRNYNAFSVGFGGWY